MSLAEPQLQPSLVVDPRTGARILTRCGSGMCFGPTLEDLVVNRLNWRLAKLTGTAVECGEPLHMLKYLPGEEYGIHMDALLGVANQREWTVLLYLSEGFGGGATRFEALGIEFRGGADDALIFRNVDQSGHGDMATRHAGLPVTSGAKWLATRWIRKSRFDPLAA
jgi:prolyl 4-hydroxylase